MLVVESHSHASTMSTSAHTVTSATADALLAKATMSTSAQAVTPATADALFAKAKSKCKSKSKSKSKPKATKRRWGEPEEVPEGVRDWTAEKRAGFKKMVMPPDWEDGRFETCWCGEMWCDNHEDGHHEEWVACSLEESMADPPPAAVPDSETQQSEVSEQDPPYVPESQMPPYDFGEEVTSSRPTKRVRTGDSPDDAIVLDSDEE